MKILALAALALGLASPSFAAAPALESINVARLLVNSPAIVDQLHKNGSDALHDITNTELKQGVTRYIMTFDRNCECIPSRAIVTITEDLTPTYRDGAPIYESSIEIKNGR